MSKKIQKRTFRKKPEIYKPQTLTCPYCGAKAILRPVTYLFGTDINPGNSSYFYVCTNYPDCNTYIGCYKNNFAPKGQLASPWLRYRRNVAHRYIDMITHKGIMTQENVYDAIACKLGLSPNQAHIRHSTDYSIEKIIEILKVILDNHGVKYNAKFLESSSYLRKREQAV